MTTDWGDVFSKLSYWYGLQFSEIAEMPLVTVSAYLQRLEARQAETKLMLVDVMAFPKMEERDKTNALQAWMRLAEIKIEKPIQKASLAKLKMIGIGVKHER